MARNNGRRRFRGGREEEGFDSGLIHYSREDIDELLELYDAPCNTPAMTVQ